MYNNIVANMSEVTKEHLPEQEKIREQEINDSVEQGFFIQGRSYVNTCGASEINVQEVTVREVSNGNDKYLVDDDTFSYKKHGTWHDSSNRDIIYFGIECLTRQFTASKGDKKMTLSLTNVKGKEEYDDVSESERNAGKSYDLDHVEIRFNGKKVTVADKRPDLTDINSIRYQLRNDKEVAHFLDKYFIVTNKERSAYKAYAKYQDKLFALEKSKNDKLFNKVND